VFDWILGSIAGLVALSFGLIWSVWGIDSLRWLRLRRTGTATTGVVVDQTRSDLRTTRIRFAAGGTDHEFLTDSVGDAAPGDVVPVRYDPRRPRRAVYPGGTGTMAVKLVTAVVLSVAFPGVLIFGLADADVILALTALGFVAGAVLGGWQRSRPYPPAKPAKATPRWLDWLLDHRGDVSVPALIVAVTVFAWIDGVAPWRMPMPLILGAVGVPYLMTRWLRRGWRELVAGVVFTVFGGIGVAIAANTAGADPKSTVQSSCAAIAGLVLIGVGLSRIPPSRQATAPPPAAPSTAAAGPSAALPSAAAPDEAPSAPPTRLRSPLPPPDRW
jgi:hypothetical protein